jgi:ElaB/YqjD/DUF883 family membrane-anchored ribosome-binding protein
MNGNSSGAFGWNGADLLARAVRRNPEGLLLLGAGVALLLRRGSSGLKAMTPERSASGMEGLRRAEEEIFADGGPARMREQGRDAIAQATGAAWDSASAGMQQAKEAAGSYLNTASQYLMSAQDTITQGSSQVKEQAGRALSQGNDFLREQPLAVAALGMAAGLVIAAVLPSTEAEERVMGPARDRLADSARDAGDRVARATGVAGSELLNAVEKRGFSRAGVKEMVSEVANSFTGALADHDASHGDSSQQRGEEAPVQRADTPVAS